MARHQSDEEYVKEIESFRREKDYFFKSDPESPIPRALREQFHGLAYFPVDPKYRVRAKLLTDPNPQKVVLATSKGVPREMIRVGFLEFEIDGMKQRLAAYKSVPQPGHQHADMSLFAPFRDATSGKETYGAARYLDIPEQKGDEYVLDFNLAYSPYCAYSEDYICPFPPRENWLSIPIRAGEKNFPLKA
ncbi:MAG TPA: DUF1684 domain-containing protein [Thermoplasmata archaeon]|nr:DUF1684 domain-containing protein [Thermoplasmata archaeon]